MPSPAGIPRHRPARLIRNAHSVTRTQPKPLVERRRSSGGTARGNPFAALPRRDALQSVTAVHFLPDAYTVVSAGASDGCVVDPISATILAQILREAFFTCVLAPTTQHDQAVGPPQLAHPVDQPFPAALRDLAQPRTAARPRLAINNLRCTASTTSNSTPDLCMPSFSCPGIASLSLDASGARLLATATDNCLHIFDCGRPLTARTEPLQTLRAHGLVTGSFFVKSCFSPDGKWVLAGSKDGHAYLFELDDPARPPLRLRGHSSEVTAVAWNVADFEQVYRCLPRKTTGSAATR